MHTTATFGFVRRHPVPVSNILDDIVMRPLPMIVHLSLTMLSPFGLYRCIRRRAIQLHWARRPRPDDLTRLTASTDLSPRSFTVPAPFFSSACRLPESRPSSQVAAHHPSLINDYSNQSCIFHGPSLNLLGLRRLRSRKSMTALLSPSSFSSSSVVAGC